MVYVVVLDACVLFPASLRDTLLRSAQADLYTIQFTEEILEEVYRNLIKKTMPENKALRLITLIREKFNDGLISDYEHLFQSMPINKKDKHVLAAAVSCRARIIVTQNLKDFPRELLAPLGVEALSADRFLIQLFQANASAIMQILIQQAEDLRNPPMTVEKILDTLKQHAPEFADRMRFEFGLRSTFS